MQNKDKEDYTFPFVMLHVILLGLASIELDEVVTSSSTPIIQTLDWTTSYQLMCDASNHALGVVLAQKIDK